MYYLLQIRRETVNSYVDVITASGFVVPRDIQYVGRRWRPKIVIGCHFGGNYTELSLLSVIYATVILLLRNNKDSSRT